MVLVVVAAEEEVQQWAHVEVGVDVEEEDVEVRETHSAGMMLSDTRLPTLGLRFNFLASRSRTLRLCMAR